jgi:hypothetical protein
MTWALIAAFGMVAWLSAATVIFGLCRAASRADGLGASGQRSVFVSGESNVVDLCAFRAARTRSFVWVDVVAEQARDRGSYLSSLDSRRSLSSLPSVWHVGQ